MNVFIKTLGCKLNYAESVALGRQLTAQGYVLVDEPAQADICIVNTCAVTANAEAKCRQAIRHLQQCYPKAIIYARGCYVNLNPGLVDELQLCRGSLPANPKKGFAAGEPVQSPHRTRAFVKIQDGCDNFCTYCTVPYARGRSRSDTIAQVLENVCVERTEGAKEMVLTGVNIGDFGRHNHESLLQLVRALDDLDGDYRIRLSSINPDDCSDELIEVVAQSKHIAPHFHLPVQSGSDEMLRIMHRRYDVALVRQRISTIRALLPYAFIGLDVIVGCRGETVEDFDQTYTLLEELPISHIHLFTYSDRPRAALAHNTTLHSVSPEEQRRRYDLLNVLSQAKEGAFRKRCEGISERVLWEGRNEAGLMSGHTGNYILCKRPYDPKRVNTFEQLTINN